MYLFSAEIRHVALRRCQINNHIARVTHKANSQIR